VVRFFQKFPYPRSLHCRALITRITRFVRVSDPAGASDALLGDTAPRPLLRSAPRRSAPLGATPRSPLPCVRASAEPVWLPSTAGWWRRRVAAAAEAGARTDGRQAGGAEAEAAEGGRRQPSRGRSRTSSPWRPAGARRGASAGACAPAPKTTSFSFLRRCRSAMHLATRAFCPRPAADSQPVAKRSP